MKKSLKSFVVSTFTLLILVVVLFVYANQNSSIPILLYHHVNYIDKSSLSVTPEMFEEQMKYLYENNYRTLFLDELIEIIKKGERFPSKSVVITFDDGYLDNWIYAYPILKKYKIKATIFMITSYAKNRKEYRPNLEDVWKGRDTLQGLPEIFDHNTANLESVLNDKERINHFLTWEEMQQMTDSGIIDIQSHTHTHSRYFVSNRIVDFNYKNYWALASCTDGDMRLGIPVYQGASAMVARRFFDDKGLRDFIVQYVEKNGGMNFFLNNEETYKEILYEQVGTYREKNVIDKKHESLDERKERIKNELNISKNLIKKNLGEKNIYIAWPWGEYNELSLNIAKELNYKAMLTTQKGSNKSIEGMYGLKRIKAWPKTNWWFALRLFVYSNAPLADFFTLFTK